ncbi:MAG: T9SS type A sorting domain-containing protein, partial [Candidatus Krumholzibacteriota bacterium]|nr:T9SS type A sorting domain-containing protein [Candidatus Krumholzibacteriota bacterium]
YHYGEHAVRNVQYAPPGPAILSHDEFVATTFDYATTEPGGVRIYNIPYSDGAMCPNSQVSGSPLYPAGEGGGDNLFSISSGEENVDQLRYYMTDANQTVMLYDIFLDTRYWFGASGVFTPAPETTPAAVVLGPNYPNPFNPATTIPVTLAEDTRVILRIYDLQGRLVATLADGTLAAGIHALPFRAEGLPSGVYLYALETGGTRRSGRMVLLK